MPELYSQVLDLKEKDVFLETEVNDTRYFSVTGIPSTLSYGKHPFSITFNDPEGQPLLKNLSNIVFEFVDSRGTVIFSDLLDIEELSGAGNGVLWIKKDPLRTAAEIADGPVYLYVMGELDGDEIPEQWKGIYNVRSTFVFDARKNYPNTSDLVLKNPSAIQTNLNISESIEFDAASSIFKRSFINVSLTNLDTDGGKIESVELAYNEQSASNEEYEVITRYPLTSGSYEITDQTKKSGLNPITNTTKIITPKQFRRNTSVRFRLRFVNPAGQLAQYLDKDRQGEIIEVTSSFITFEGSPFFLERFDNLLKGSLFTGNAVGKGFEQSGRNSAFLKTVDYEGFISASVGSGSAGILFYSGSVLTSSGDNYDGVGLELHGGKGSGSFRFSTSPNLLEITADTFFVGNENSQFISGSGGFIEISSSGYHLTPEGQVTASAILLGDKSAGQFLQFIDDTLTVQGSITADSIRTPSSIGGAPSTDQNASSSISSQGFATFKSASIGGFIISPTEISSSGLVLKSSGQMTGSTTLIGDKGAGQFLQFVDDALTVQGDITANSIRTPASIGGSPSTISNASSSIDSQGFALFKSASIGGFDVNETEISSSGLLLKSSGQITGSSTLIGDKAGGNFLQFVDDTLTVQGDITANAIRTPATIGGVASTDANASASISSDGLAIFKSGSIAGWQIFGNILSGSNVSLDSQGAALFKSDQGPGSDASAAFDQLRDEYYIDFTPSDQGNTKNYYVKFGPNFSVDSSGTLFASGAVFQGTITASAGLIGGFNTNDVAFSGTNIFISGSPLVGGVDDDKYMFISTSNFNVKENGDITASAANITGDITANTITANTAGTIANFTLNSSEIKSSNNNLRLKSSGQITGSNVLFSGGKIAGFDISGTKLQQGTSFHLDGFASATYFISSSNFQVTPSGQVSGSQVLFDGGNIGGFALLPTAISSSNGNLRLKSSGQITGSNVLFSGGKIAGFDISGTKLQQGSSFHLDGNDSADYFISSSKFQVSPSGDVSGSQVLFTGGKIGGFTLSSTQISSSGLLLESTGKISGSNVFFTGGTVGGFTITDSVIRNNNNTVSLSSALPGLLIKDGGGTDRVLVKSGSLSTVGGGTQYIGNKSFEDDSISAGRNFVSTITSWSFVEGGSVNISLTDRSSYPDDDKAVSGDVTLDVVVPAGSSNYSGNNTYEISQIITASVAEGDTISFSSVARFSSSFGGRGKDRALGPQYFRLEYSGSDTDGFVPFLPEANFTASNGYGEYFLGSGQYSSFGASADLPSAASFIKVVVTGSINDDTGFSIEKPLFAGDKGTVPTELKGKKFTKQVRGSTTAENPETEITFDNFSVRSNTRRVEVTQEGILIYNSEDSFFKMTGAGIELRGGSGVASFGQAINRESFTNDSQVAGTLGAPALQAYISDPEDIGTTASDGNVAEFAKGNHVHRITFSTINSVLSGQTLTNVFNGTFGGSAATLISGSFVDVSSSFSTRISNNEATGGNLSLASGSFSSRVTTLEQQDVDDDLTIAGDSGGNLSIDMDSETLTLAGGTGITTVGAGNTITINASEGVISSSAQIATDISGSFVAPSASISTRLTTEEGNIDTLQGRNLIAGTGLTGGGTLASDRTFNVGEGTGISVGADAISTNDSEIVHDNLSGFVANEHINHSSVTLTAGTGLTGGGDITTNRTFAIDFTDSSFKSAVSGSYKGDGVISGSAQIATDISGSFVAPSSSFSSRVTTLEQQDVDDDLTIAGDSGGNLSIDMDSETLTIAGGTGIDTSGNTNTITVTTNDSEIVHDNLSGFVANEHIDHSSVSVIAGAGLTGGGTIAANRTLDIGAGTGVTVNANDVAIGQDVATTSKPLFAAISSSGDISGSSTSTGSFGRVEVAYPGRSSFPGGIDVGTFNAAATQLILKNRGTQAAPAIAFGGDENTGIYQTSDNQFSIGLNNNQILAATYYNFDVKWNLRVGQSNNTTITYDGTKISGSAVSTGSFGKAIVGVADFGGGISDSVPIGLQVSTGENSKIRLNRNNSLSNYLDIVGGTQGGIYNINSSATNAHIFKTSNTERVRITTTGLGIGTTDIDYKLDVHGDIRLTDSIYSFEDGTGRTYLREWFNFGSGHPSYKTGANDKYHNFKNYSGTDIMRIGGSNNRVSIGTHVPSHALDVRNSGDTIIQAKAVGTGRAKLHLDALNDIAEIYFKRNGSLLGAIYQESDGTKLNVYYQNGSSYGYEIMTWNYSDGKVGIKQHSPSYDLDVTGTGRFTDDLRVEGDIIAENFIVSSSVTYMTTSFSAGSTAFGDTPADDTHQFTGSLTVTGSSVIANSGQDPTAILSDPHSTSSYGLHVRGLNKGIRFDRFNSDGHVGAGTTIYQNGSDWTVIVQNNNDPIGDPDANTNLGVAVNRLGGAFYPQNNSIDFSGYEKSFTRLGVTQLEMTNNFTFKLGASNSFIVSGSLIQFTPTEKVNVTGNIVASGNIISAGTAPRLRIQETDSTDSFEIFEMEGSGGSINFNTRNSSAGFVSTDHQIGRNASGANSFKWNIGGTRIFELAANTISGSSTSTGSFGTLRTIDRLTIDVPNSSPGSTTRGIIDINEPHQSGGDAFLMTYNNANSDFYIMSDQGRMKFYTSPSPAYDGTGQAGFMIMANMDDDGTYMAVGNGNLSNVPLQVKPNMISGSAATTGSFGSVILKSGYPNGTNSSTLDIYSTNSYTRYHSIGYYGYIDAVLGQYLRSRDALFLGTSDGSHVIEIRWGPIGAHRMSPAAGMSDFKIFAGSSGSNSMDGDDSGGAGFGFYTSGGSNYHLAFQPYFHGSGCDVIHSFESTSGVKTEGFRLNSSGHLLPGADNTHDLGSSTKRWANIHSADLHLSNEDTKGNEVDGTTGNWTIQEGEDDLYLLNRKNGKKYRFKLEEIK